MFVSRGGGISDGFLCRKISSSAYWKFYEECEYVFQNFLVSFFNLSIYVYKLLKMFICGLEVEENKV